MTPKQFQQQLKQFEKRAAKFMATDGPEYAANKAVELFKENFEQEGFFDNKWKEVQRRASAPAVERSRSTRSNRKGKKTKADHLRKILAGRTGNLRNSINYRTAPGTAIIYSDTPYGKFHNEGIAPQPKRQFIGEHPELNKAVITELDKQIKKILKK